MRLLCFCFSFLLLAIGIFAATSTSHSADSQPLSQGDYPGALFLESEIQVGGEIKQVVAEGNYLYVTREDGTSIYSVNDATAPTFIALLPDIIIYAAEGDYLYGHGEASDEWQIWKVQPTEAPTLVGAFTPSGYFVNAASNALYFGGMGTVFIYTLQNPITPYLIGTWQLNEPNQTLYEIDWIAATENQLAVSFYITFCERDGCHEYYSTLKILDISNPAAPQLLREASPDLAKKPYQAVSDTHLYLVEPGESHISSVPLDGSEIDVSHPTEGFYPYDLTVYEDTLYVAGTIATGEHKTKIFDIAKPSVLNEIAQVSEVIMGVVENRFLFAYASTSAMDTKFITQYNLQNPHLPQRIADIPHPTRGIWLKKGDGFILISTFDDGRVYVHHIENDIEGIPYYAGAAQLPERYSFVAYAIVAEQYLYVLSAGELYIYALPILTNTPTLIDQTTIPECLETYCDLYVTPEALVIDNRQLPTLAIYSLADPTLPHFVTTVETRARINVAVEGNRVYSADDFTQEDPSIHIIDLSDPAAPIFLGDFPAMLYPNQKFTVAEGYLYYFHWLDHQIKVIDIRVPEVPMEVAAITPPFGSDTMAMEQETNRLYFWNDGQQVAIYDVARPAMPHLLGNYRSPAGNLVGSSLAIEGSRLYFADLRNGLQTLRMVEGRPTFLPLLQKQ